MSEKKDFSKKKIGTGIPTNMGMDHVGIVVPNAQEAADFLMDVFDAEFDWEVKREPKPTFGERGWDKVFDVHSDAYLSHVIMLKCGDQPLTQYIELFEWYAPDQYKPHTFSGWPKFSDISNSYISFTVKNMEKVIEHIKNNVFQKWKGTRLIQDPPMQFPLRGEICTSTFLVSPWGMWIELTSWSDSQVKGKIIKSQQVTEENTYIGKSIYELPTPAFIIDLDIVDHNVNLMKTRIKEKNVEWRIPCKAHKCPNFAKYLLNKSGAQGVVLLTLKEAQLFAEAGIDDIYLANQVESEEKLLQLSLLAKKVKRLRVAVDNIEYLHSLSKAVDRWEIKTPIEILVEVNINHNRCGANVVEAIAIAKAAKLLEMNKKTIIFSGVTGYEGHTPILPPDQKTLETQKSHNILSIVKTEIEKLDIPVMVVSGGGSCNYIDCLNIGILTEIQAGGGALGDLLYYEKANLKNYGHKMGALILSQIISMPTDCSRAIGNAGFKTTGWHPFGGLPQPRDRVDLEVIGLSAEHTKFQGIRSSGMLGEVFINNLKWGDKVVLIPGYTDAMGLLHSCIYAMRHDNIENVWQTISVQNSAM